MRETILRNAGVHRAPEATNGTDIAIYRIAGGDDALATLHSLWQSEGQLGGWPILIGASQELKYLEECLKEAAPASRWLAQADAWRGLDVHQVLRAAKEAELEHLRKHNRLHPDQAAPEIMLTLLQNYIDAHSELPAFEAAGWPSKPADHRFGLQCLYDPLEDHVHEEVFLAIVNCASTDVAAYLSFGGWNSCPAPSAHVAVARIWNRRFGAVPAAVTHDTIEFFVERPPTSPIESWQLAWEQEAYAEVTDGAQDGTKPLAQALWNCPHWSMWWD